MVAEFLARSCFLYPVEEVYLIFGQRDGFQGCSLFLFEGDVHPICYFNMFIREASEEDSAEILDLYSEGYFRGVRAGVEIWEEPTAESVEVLLPDLFVVGDRTGMMSAVLKLTGEPNRLIWDDELAEDVFYLSKIAVSGNAVGYLGFSHVLELIFGLIGDDAVLRWDVLSRNSSSVKFYEHIGASVVGERVFMSPKRQEEVSVVLLELNRG